MFNRYLKKAISAVLALTILLTPALFAFPVRADESLELGPVTSKDVVYQIITDRFYDGDPTNNVPAGFDPTLFDGTGDDLKLYQGGDWAGIIDKIPYLKGMGVTAVWISAPYENRDTEILDYKADGSYDRWTSFHGYHVRNYFATNKHFGTLNEFEELRDALHDNGIKLIIDFVTNHTSREMNPTAGNIPEDGKLYEPDRKEDGSFAFDENGEPYDYNGDGLVENLIADPQNDTLGWFHGLGDRGSDSSRFGYRYKDLGSLADFSQENGMVAQYLEEATLFWANMGVNGIRHDATLHLNPAFVKGLKDAVDSSNTVTHFGEFFIGRPDPKYDEYVYFPKQTGVNNLDFEFFRAASTTFGDFSTTMADFGDMLMYTQDDYEYENQTVTFLDNHDVSRFGYLQRNEKPYNAALATLLTSRGIPNIYYGTEQYVVPADGSDVSGRIFMETDSEFNTQTTAYQLIGDLSELRQSNDAIAYGTTVIRYSDDNVLVYERQFYDDVVLVAVNRQPDQSYTIGPVETNLPAGNYNDYLGGLLYGFNTVVTAGEGINHTSSFTLPGGAVCVWQYKGPASSTPQIGDVMSTMGRVGNQVYIYGDGLNGDVSVKFGDVEAVVESNSANQIVTKVPAGAVPGDNNITVTKGSSVSNAFVYSVLSGDQNQIIFHVQANTAMGENIYIVGNIPELGSWDPNNCTEAMLNPNYPEWFLPVSVPAGTQIEFKFIKKDANGTVTWESGENRVITSSSSSAGSIDTEVYTWRS
ncbi:alpha-amylase family glycosyl hydrolase [Candidatus Allofournierella merdavium]|uniref:alpha-amylase family glycosyl hydrolase n=1 Tax=Candidatus Allofournierella merdavium TaxID=2838593 RepID=UPI00374E974B